MVFTCGCPIFSTVQHHFLKKSFFSPSYLSIFVKIQLTIPWASQVVSVVKNPPANAGDVRDAGLIPGSGRSPGGGHGNSLQYSCLENLMNRGAWQATVHGVTENRTRLSNLACIHVRLYQLAKKFILALP